MLAVRDEMRRYGRNKTPCGEVARANESLWVQRYLSHSPLVLRLDESSGLI
jgi:hypothetical protein